MNTALSANTLTHLRFCARNRVVLVFGLLVAGVLVLTSVPALLFASRTSRFEVVMSVASTLSHFVVALLGLIALLLVWYHRSQRCVKLVFTKPCSPEAWVFSHYLTAGVLCLAGTALTFVLTGVLMAVWGLPWQWGLPGAMVCNLTLVAFVFSYLMMLSTVMHPVLAFFAMLALSDGTFYYLSILCRAGATALEPAAAKLVLGGLGKLCLGVYILLPGGPLFDEQLSRLKTGYRLGAEDWKYLAGDVAYAVLFMLLMYRITVYALKKQRHV